MLKIKLIGNTSAGKSTFIKSVMGQDYREVFKNITSKSRTTVVSTRYVFIPDMCAGEIKISGKINDNVAHIEDIEKIRKEFTNKISEFGNASNYIQKKIIEDKGLMYFKLLTEDEINNAFYSENTLEILNDRLYEISRDTFGEDEWEDVSSIGSISDIVKLVTNPVENGAYFNLLEELTITLKPIDGVRYKLSLEDTKGFGDNTQVTEIEDRERLNDLSYNADGIIFFVGCRALDENRVSKVIEDILSKRTTDLPTLVYNKVLDCDELTTEEIADTLFDSNVPENVKNENSFIISDVGRKQSNLVFDENIVLQILERTFTNIGQSVNKVTVYGKNRLDVTYVGGLSIAYNNFKASIDYLDALANTEVEMRMKNGDEDKIAFNTSRAITNRLKQGRDFNTSKCKKFKNTDIFPINDMNEKTYKVIEKVAPSLQIDITGVQFLEPIDKQKLINVALERFVSYRPNICNTYVRYVMKSKCISYDDYHTKSVTALLDRLVVAGLGDYTSYAITVLVEYIKEYVEDNTIVIDAE